MQVVGEVCEEQVGHQVTEWNADVVLWTDDRVSSEGLGCTNVQFERDKLRCREPGQGGAEKEDEGKR